MAPEHQDGWAVAGIANPLARPDGKQTEATGNLSSLGGQWRGSRLTWRWR